MPWACFVQLILFLGAAARSTGNFELEIVTKVQLGLFSIFLKLFSDPIADPVFALATAAMSIDAVKNKEFSWENELGFALLFFNCSNSKVII